VEIAAAEATTAAPQHRCPPAAPRFHGRYFRG
jgi:hypothetical protein